MPTYEYQCTDHGHRFEVFQRIGEDPITACTECGGPVRKVFHPVGVVLKGSGFYKTDSRSSKRPSDEKKEPKDTKKDTTPEKKTESKKGEKSA